MLIINIGGIMRVRMVSDLLTFTITQVCGYQKYVCKKTNTKVHTALLVAKLVRLNVYNIKVWGLIMGKTIIVSVWWDHKELHSCLIFDIA